MDSDTRVTTHGLDQRAAALPLTVSPAPPVRLACTNGTTFVHPLAKAVVDGLDGLCGGCREFKAMCEQHDEAVDRAATGQT